MTHHSPLITTLVVGIALLLSGIGFIILALVALGGVFREKAAATRPATATFASH